MGEHIDKQELVQRLEEWPVDAVIYPDDVDLLDVLRLVKSIPSVSCIPVDVITKWCDGEALRITRSMHTSDEIETLRLMGAGTQVAALLWFIREQSEGSIPKETK